MAQTYVIISGGTGANSIASAFGANPAFVLPVSDDGGSSSEILRCFGGPSIGDITCPPGAAVSDLSPEEEEITAIHELLAYRFPSDASEKHVREIWSEIVEGRSSLWDGIGEDKKECIRAFLVHFQTLALRRAHKRFSFRNFSLGNGFLTGARDMFGSLPSAIFLFKSIASVPSGAAVIPVINTNQTVTIAVECENGETIVGQCAISHPAEPPASVLAASASVGGADAAPGLDTMGQMADGLQGLDHDGGQSSGVRDHPGAGSGMSITRPPARTNSMRLRTHFRRDSRTFDTTPMDTPAVSARTSLDGTRPRLDTLGDRAAVNTGAGSEGLFSPQTAGSPIISGIGGASTRRRDKEAEEQLGSSNIGYVKGKEEVPLEARIQRLFYINLYGQEIFPSPNPDFLSALSKRDVLVYSCGSLWTSIIPCLALRGLASAIATSPSLKARIVLLNSHNDRETPDFTASDYISTLIAMLGHYDRPRRADPVVRRGSDGTVLSSSVPPLQTCQWEARRLVSHVVYLEGAEVEVDKGYFEEHGIELFCIPQAVHEQAQAPGKRLFTPEAVEWALEQIMRRRP